MDEDDYLQLLAEGGYMIQKIAKILHPEGVEIDFEEDVLIAAHKTAVAMRNQVVTLFETTFISNSKLIRTDIIIKDGNVIHLIEVKAKSVDSRENQEAIKNGRPNLFRTGKGNFIADWSQYLEDVAFQVLVLKELYPSAIIHPYLMMPDKSKTTEIEKIHSLFELRRVQIPESDRERIVVEFTGDAERLRKSHFLTLVPVSTEVELVLASIRAKVDPLISSLRPRLQKINTELSVDCRNCEFRSAAHSALDGYRMCWGPLANVTPHLFDLYHISSIGGRGGSVANRLIRKQAVSLFDIRQSDLVKEDGNVGKRNRRQLIQIEHTRSGTEWFSNQLPKILRSFRFPLHFIDFETTAMAIPYHAGMHPYEPVAFQWSCHTLRSPDGPLEHAEWINVEDAFPNFEFAETLMEQIGSAGTIFMWATHENSILRTILRQIGSREHVNLSLRLWLERIVSVPRVKTGRLIDMNQLTLRHYFHPLMKGKTSIKVVADAIWKSNSALRSRFPEYVREKDRVILSPYDALPPIEIEGKPLVVAEGTGAIRAYEAMLYGTERKDSQIKERWKTLLLQYCKLDTLSMVFVWHHWNFVRNLV